MDRRTEEQRLRGVIPVTWAGQTREIPTLKRGASRAWKEGLGSALGEVGKVEVGAIESLATAGALASDRMLDLVMEYDKTGVLGTREWIDENVDDLEVYTVFRTLLDVAYPFVSDLRGAMEEIRGLGLLASASPASTSSPSPSGASPRKRSTTG
jgi:hypothetical protein